MKAVRRVLCLLSMVALSVLSPAASSTVVGTLDIVNCTGGGVSLGLNSIDWFLPVGGGNGCILTGAATTLTYNGGTPLPPGTSGLITDAAVGAANAVNFMTFAGVGFDLVGFGPGVANTNCAIGVACSPVSGSPFVLTPLAGGGTDFTLLAHLVAHDAGAATANFDGTFFRSRISAQGASTIQSVWLAGGFVETTYTGDFNPAAGNVPEPTTLALLSLGLGGLALARRRKRS